MTVAKIEIYDYYAQSWAEFVPAGTQQNSLDGQSFSQCIERILSIGAVRRRVSSRSPQSAWYPMMQACLVARQKSGRLSGTALRTRSGEADADVALGLEVATIGGVVSHKDLQILMLGKTIRPG